MAVFCVFLRWKMLLLPNSISGYQQKTAEHFLYEQMVWHFLGSVFTNIMPGLCMFLYWLFLVCCSDFYCGTGTFQIMNFFCKILVQE